MSCPDENLWAALVDAPLPPAEAAALHLHLESCGACLGMMAKLATGLETVGDAPGTTIGPYTLVAELGRGGMGVVWRARDGRLGREVALKFISARFEGDERATARFLREARSASALSHVNVAAVYEVGAVAGRPYLAMALLDGESLKERLGHGPVPMTEAVEILSGMAAGLGAAHLGAVVHRDVKPGNVMLTSTGVKLVDFGLAKLETEVTLTESGMAVGTLAYMAPEQHRGDRVDPRADVWSLGVVGYELLTGRLPFLGTTAGALIDAMGKEPPSLRSVRPEIPADLQTIVMKCLERDPSRRYASAQLVADELGRFVTHRPIEARPPSLRYRAQKLVRRHRVLGAVLAVLLFAATAATGWAIRERQRATEREQEAQLLGQRVQKMRSVMRDAHLMPVHDLTHERDEVRAEMAAITEAMQRLGKAFDGPGHFGLGTGWLVLGDSLRAAPELEAAWAAGEHGSDVALALGLVLGARYHDELAKVGGSPEERTAARNKLQSQYAKRAIAVLRQANGVRDAAPGYVEALIAFNDHRFVDAEALGEKSFNASPRYYETGIIAAQSASRHAHELLNAGDRPGALAELQRARDLYQRTLVIARSDERVYYRFAELLVDQWAISGEVRVDAEGDLHRVVDLVHTAAALQVDRWVALHIEAMAWSRLGEKHDANSKANFDKAVALADEACTLSNHDWRAELAAADTYGMRGAWEISESRDPQQSYVHSLAAYRQAQLGSPSDGDIARNLVITLSELAHWQGEHGVDARATLAELLRQARELVAHGNSDFPSQGSLARAAWLNARAQLARGEDATALADEAEKWAREMIVAAKSSSDGPSSLAEALTLKAELDIRAGRDPRAHFAEAQKAAEDSIAIENGGADLCDAAANAYLVEAEWHAEQGRRAPKVLAHAQRHIDRALAIEPTSLDTMLLAARAARVVGNRARARALVDKVLKVDPSRTSAKRQLQRNYLETGNP